MAVHTGLGRWNVGEAGSFRRSMAVTAIHPEPTYVMRVAEGHRLLAGLGGASGVIGAAQFGESPTQESQDEQCAEDGDSRECICAATKKLRHRKPGFPCHYCVE